MVKGDRNKTQGEDASMHAACSRQTKSRTSTKRRLRTFPGQLLRSSPRSLRAMEEKGKFEDMAKVDKVQARQGDEGLRTPKGGAGKASRKKKDQRPERLSHLALSPFGAGVPPTVKSENPNLSIGETATAAGRSCGRAQSISDRARPLGAESRAKPA
ncbi:high mobility group protein B2-like [Cyprinus carpio]|uniref:High mobility group protein B2-like n=1 Tax=Cyprinus carpio TaxID=7962 RepID=A0A9Q9XXK3_CYPCA|nr:high mobility group protein B2-like [Cyprinus carpio]